MGPISIIFSTGPKKLMEKRGEKKDRLSLSIKMNQDIVKKH